MSNRYRWESKIRKSAVTINVVLWPWSENNAGAHPVRVCVTFNRRRKYYALVHDSKKLFLTEETWKIIQDRSKKVRGDNSKIRESIDRTSTQAGETLGRALRGNKAFSFLSFEREFVVAETGQLFLAFFEKHLQSLRAEGRIGTYRELWKRLLGLQKIQA